MFLHRVGLNVIGICSIAWGLGASVPRGTPAADLANEGADDRYEKYFEFLQRVSLPKGSWGEGEIEILDDPLEIAKVEEKRYRQFIEKGFSEEESWDSSRVGIVAQDPYFILVRDAVRFPTDRTGTYFRYIWKSPDHEASGAAVLPVLPDGRIALILNFRHATRSWEFELPRGAKEKGETMDQAVRRELHEETGWIADSVEELGGIVPNTSAEGQRVPIYIARLKSQESAEKGNEAIRGTYFFTKEEVLEGFKLGYLEVGGERYNFRGSFEAYALLQAILKGYFINPSYIPK